MTTVYLEVDGKPHPATQCNWLEIAPCGRVPTEISDGMQKVAAMCGHESRGWCWSDDFHRLYDTVPCLNCLRRAAAVTS